LSPPCSRDNIRLENALALEASPHLAMPPNRHQKAKPSGTSSTKTAEKGQLLEARTIKRTELEEARRVDAERHKDAVRVYCAIRAILPGAASKEAEKLTGRLRETRTFMQVNTSKLSRSIITRSKSMAQAPRTSRTWPRRG
jgi:hypothetical protein